MGNLDQLRAQALAEQARRELAARQNQGRSDPRPMQGPPTRDQSRDQTRAMMEQGADAYLARGQEVGGQIGTALNMAGSAMTGGLVGPRAGAAADALIGRGSEGETFGDRYDERLRFYLDNQNALRADNPTLAYGSEIGGALVPGTAIARYVAGAPRLLGQAVRSAVTGGAYGGSYNALNAEPGDMQRQGIIGAALGGAVGGALPVVAAGARGAVNAGRRAVDALRGGSPASRAAADLGRPRPAVEAVMNRIDGTNPGAAISAVARGGDDAMLADATPRLRQLLDSATQQGGGASGSVADAVQARAAAAARRVTQTFDDIMGRAQGVRTAGAAIRDAARPSTADAYRRAWAATVDYSTPQGQRLTDLLESGRITPTWINRANRLLGEEGLDRIPAIGQGQVPQLSSQQWDAIARALGDAAQTQGAGAAGGANNATRVWTGLQRTIRDNLRAINPAYDDALRISSGTISEVDATRIGYDLLRPGMTTEQVSTALRGAGQSERVAAMQGLRSYLDDVMGRVGIVASDGNVEARELQRLLTPLTSRTGRSNIRTLLGDQADALFKEVDEAVQAFTLRSSIARNSATAARTADRSMIQDLIGPSLAEEMITSNPITAATRAATGLDARSMMAAEKVLWDQVADLLVTTRGQDAIRALQILNRAAQGSNIGNQASAYLRRVLTTAILGSGAPAATQTPRSVQGALAP